MVKYFPFPSGFNLSMGTAPMKTGDLIVETDEHYIAEINLKRSLLTEDHAYYFNALPGSGPAEWDAVEAVINDLIKGESANFQADKSSSPQWLFRNKLLDENFNFTFGDDSTLPCAPLDWIGRQVQEDLILLNAAGEVIAGQLCFPSGWALHEKLGRQFMDVHAPLPEVMSPMIQSANKLLERIPLNKPVARNNWGFRLGDQLDFSSKHSATYRRRLDEDLPGMSREDFGRKIFLRVEHQTLTRLPRSGCILFTIHTYNSRLQAEATDPTRAQTLLSFLKTVPATLIEYKVMAPFYDKLIDYLETLEFNELRK